VSIFLAVVFLAVLIIIHEMGHFFAARAFNIKCTEFAVGFGPKIFGKKVGEVEYTWRALPLGGFVRIIGMDDSEELTDDILPPNELHRAYFNAAPWKRAVVLAAGPMANLILPVFIYFFMLITPREGESTLIGHVVPGKPAAEAGIVPGDRIVAANGKVVAAFNQLSEIITERPGIPTPLKVAHGDATRELTVTPARIVQKDRFGNQQEIGRIGISSQSVHADIGVAETASPAFDAGLRTWDRIVALNDTPVKSWADVDAWFAASPGGRKGLVRIKFERPTELTRDGIAKGPRATAETILDIADPVQSFAPFGVTTSELFVLETEAAAPVAKILQKGDQILKFDGEPVADLAALYEILTRDPTRKEHAITFRRDAEVKDATFAMWSTQVKGPGGVQLPDDKLGFTAFASLYPTELVRYSYGPVESVGRAFTTTVNQAYGMLYGIYMMIAGRVPSNSVGGPIMLFQLAQESASQGFLQLFAMICIISLNLGLLNLFPIPLLDGGHLTVLAVESLIRRPLPQRFRIAMNIVGLVVLISIFLFATKNDVFRLLSRASDS
jgi:regulator of sigma E protease